MGLVLSLLVEAFNKGPEKQSRCATFGNVSAVQSLRLCVWGWSCPKEQGCFCRRINTFRLPDTHTIASRICSAQRLFGMIGKHSNWEEEVARAGCSHPAMMKLMGGFENI